MVQWLTEEVVIEISDGILGPPSETPYDGLKDAILTWKGRARNSAVTRTDSSPSVIRTFIFL